MNKLYRKWCLCIDTWTYTPWMETMCPPCSIIFQALGLAIPPRMHVDPSKSAAFFGIWPHVNDFGYSIPCHACCGHGNFTGYCSPTPPCSHFPPPQYQCSLDIYILHIMKLSLYNLFLVHIIRWTSQVLDMTRSSLETNIAVGAQVTHTHSRKMMKEWRRRSWILTFRGKKATLRFHFRWKITLAQL